jgi:hypothetical protein
MKGHIHTLVFLAFTALALPLSGCIIDNTNSTNTCASLYLTWSIDDNLGHSLLCSDVGAGYVRVTAAGVVTDVPCGAGSAQIFSEPSGTYPVDVQLRDFANASIISEATQSYSVPCGGLNLGNVFFCVGSACPP